MHDYCSHENNTIQKVLSVNTKQKLMNTPYAEFKILTEC